MSGQGFGLRVKVQSSGLRLRGPPEAKTRAPPAIWSLTARFRNIPFWIHTDGGPSLRHANLAGHNEYWTNRTPDKTNTGQNKCWTKRILDKTNAGQNEYWTKRISLWSTWPAQQTEYQNEPDKINLGKRGNQRRRRAPRPRGCVAASRCRPPWPCSLSCVTW